MKQHGKKARQERALDRLNKAHVMHSKGWKAMLAWEAENNAAVPGDEYISHNCNWQERRDAEAEILKGRIAFS